MPDVPGGGRIIGLRAISSSSSSSEALQEEVVKASKGVVRVGLDLVDGGEGPVVPQDALARRDQPQQQLLGQPVPGGRAVKLGGHRVGGDLRGR